MKHQNLARKIALRVLQASSSLPSETPEPKMFDGQKPDKGFWNPTVFDDMHVKVKQERYKDESMFEVDNAYDMAKSQQGQPEIIDHSGLTPSYNFSQLPKNVRR